MKFVRICIAILIMAGGVGEIVWADSSIRCDGRLVAIGAEKDEVLKTCGEPDERERWEAFPNSDIFRIFDYKTGRYHLPRFIKGPLYMERWTYRLGFNRFSRILEFENGTLIRIQTGPKEGGG